MQEEIENRSVNLVITTTRLSVRALMDGIRQFVNNVSSEARLQRETKSRNKARSKQQKKEEGPHGRQTVKQLLRHSSNVKQIPVSEGSLKDFKQVLKKYGVDFALVKDASTDKARYLAFFKAKDEAVMSNVLAECTNRQLHKSKEKRPSMLAEMRRLKEMIAKRPKKVHRKEKDLSR